MKAKTSIRTSIRLFSGAISVLITSNIYAQTLLNLGSQGRNADFTNFPYTRPIKTGTTLPATCGIGDVFLNTNANPGQNLFFCPTVNTWAQQLGLGDPGAPGLLKRTTANVTTAVAAPSSAIVGISDTQTLTNKSIDAAEITSGTLSSSRVPALTGDVSTAPSSSLTTLATVNLSPGTFGDATHALQLTVDNKGRVTALNSLAISQSGGSSATTNSGALSAIPGACATGSLFLATDQPVGQQLYTCSSSNGWVAPLSVGPSGALASTGGSLDIVTTVVPRLTAANSFTGLNTFNSGVKLAPSTAQPLCDTNARGSVWFQNNGAAKDSLQVCAYSGSAYSWITLY